MGSLHRQVAVVVQDEKLNCFDFGQKKNFKTKRDNFYPGPEETSSGWWLPIALTLVLFLLQPSHAKHSSCLIWRANKEISIALWHEHQLDKLQALWYEPVRYSKIDFSNGVAKEGARFGWASRSWRPWVHCLLSRILSSGKLAILK